MTTPLAEHLSHPIVTLARTWIGTPYHHQAAVCQVGCDCLGLVRGVYRQYTGYDPENPPAYSRDWAEATGSETMIAAASRHLTSIAPADAAPGHVLIFRLRDGLVAKHASIFATPATMIHAIEGVPVAEVSYSSWWHRHLAAVFAFPSS